MPGRLPGPNGLQSYDPATAKSRLASAGVKLKSLHLLVENTPEGHALGALVKSQLAQNLGIDVTVDAVAADTYATRIQNRDFDLAGPRRWLADYPDPQDWLDQFTTGSGANAGRWQDPLFDDLVQLGDSSLDQSSRERAYAQAQLELDAQAPAIFIDQPVAWVHVSARVRGLATSESDPVPALGASDVAALDVAG
jgi:oligopeptide transport system substrate-binding protein